MSSSHALQLDQLTAHMRNVMQAERALHELALMWRMMESSAKILCTDNAHNVLAMLASTRASFQHLEKDLLHTMAEQCTQEVMKNLSTASQQVINIVVRNLYERTADVGFLATDPSVCQFVAGLEQAPSAHTIRESLREYRSKYTVYNEVWLLDTQGKVLAQTDLTDHILLSQEPSLAKALRSTSYVESFGPSDLRPTQPQALLYTQRILHPRTQQPCGVLCLSFDFEGEMAGIFKDISRQQSNCITLLLDSQDRVIASSNEEWIALGCRVPTHQDGRAHITAHTGRNYLIKSTAATNYQGYPGPPGWKAQVMLPLELAFHHSEPSCVAQLPVEMGQGLLSHARTFCPPLFGIIQTAESIRREVWNAQVMTAGQQHTSHHLQAVLEQIGEIGAQTNEVVTASIQHLYDSVLSASLRDHRALTCLQVDLLDRNLYERANDCRWWALSPALRQLLTAHLQGMPTHDLQQRARDVLAYINGLYTVYQRLMVYDYQGRMLCASHPQQADGRSVLDMTMDANTLHAVQQLKGSQAYYVTPWSATQTGAEQATYIFHAPIFSLQSTPRFAGGIGIVFNAIEEMQAMLHSSLAGKPKVAACYINRQGQVLVGTNDPLHTGRTLQLPAPHLLQLAPGTSQAVIASYQGQYGILSCSASRGYREFKTTDGYRNDVLALSFEPLGAIVQELTPHHVVHSHKNGQTIQMATFYVGKQLFALHADVVVQALPCASINRVSAGRIPFCVGTIACASATQQKDYVWVFDLAALCGGGAMTPRTEQSQVVIFSHQGQQIGMVATALHGVHHFQHEQLVAAPGLAGVSEDFSHHLVEELIQINGGQLLIPCINPGHLFQRLLRTAPKHPAPSSHAI